MLNLTRTFTRIGCNDYCFLQILIKTILLILFWILLVGAFIGVLGEQERVELDINSTFLDLGSILNIDQHEIIFPVVYNMIILGGGMFFKFGSLLWQPTRKKIIDIFFLKLEPSSFPMMYKYCF